MVEIPHMPRSHSSSLVSNTLMCLNIGAPKNNKFSICTKWKLYFFRCPKIWANYSPIIMSSNIGTPNNHHFPFETDGKIVVLGVPIPKHFRAVIHWFVRLYVEIIHEHKRVDYLPYRRTNQDISTVNNPLCYRICSV